MSQGNESRSLIKQFIPLDSLSDTHQDDVLRKGRFDTFPKGKILFKRDEEAVQLHFLIEGEVDLADASFDITKITAGTDLARNALDDHAPHSVTAITTTEVQIFSVEKDYLDLVLTWDEAGSYLVTELHSEVEEELESDWMSCLLQSHIFAQIPPANIQQLFSRFEEVDLERDGYVVRQGDPGDYFYVLKSGHARIVRRMSSDGELNDVVLAELHPGDVFGEDALIGDAPRNASIIMNTPGQLMRLGKDDFHELMHQPVLQQITFEQYQQQVADADSKVELIDVRLPLEFKQAHVPGSRSMPLNSLRQNLDKLSADTTYVMTCDGGRRSTLAAYILNQNGFAAVVLEDPPDVAA